MNSGIGVNKTTNFPNLESKGGIFERLLHLSRAELTEVSSILGGSTLTDIMGDLCEGFTCLNSGQDFLDAINCLLFASRDLFVSESVHWIS